MKKIFIIPVLLIAFSCKKEKVSIPESTSQIVDTPIVDTPISPSEIIAGTASSSITIIDINPDTLIYRWEYETIYQMGIGFKFTNKNSHPGGGLLTNEQNYIETLSNDCYILCDSIYLATTQTGSTVSQANVNSLYPKILSVNDTISVQGKWRSAKLLLSSYGTSGGFNQPAVITTEGYWKGAGDKYIAIRHGNLLGWIKISVPNYGIKIYEYAMSYQ